jgi:hypothetical protein
MTILFLDGFTKGRDEGKFSNSISVKRLHCIPPNLKEEINSGCLGWKCGTWLGNRLALAL